MANNLSEQIYRRMKDGIERWNEPLLSDIYAISFYVSDTRDDPRKPTLTLGYNTRRHWMKSVSRASSEEEAKWNYAFWPQTREAFFGDENDGILTRAWLKSLKLFFTDSEEEKSFDKTVVLGEKIRESFFDLAASVAKSLHTEGVIQAKFGKAVPIIVHELEYNDFIALKTKKANPPRLVEEFGDWIGAMYHKTRRPSPAKKIGSTGKESLSKLQTLRQKIDQNLKKSKKDS